MKYATQGKCLTCDFNGSIDIHHVKSRAAGGSNDDFNLMPLCRKCHSAIHKLGRSTFIKKNKLSEYMVNKGWEYLEFNNKWYHKDE